MGLGRLGGIKPRRSSVVALMELLGRKTWTQHGIQLQLASPFLSLVRWGWLTSFDQMQSYLPSQLPFQTARASLARYIDKMSEASIRSFEAITSAFFANGSACLFPLRQCQSHFPLGFAYLESWSLDWCSTIVWLLGKVVLKLQRPENV